MNPVVSIVSSPVTTVALVLILVALLCRFVVLGKRMRYTYEMREAPDGSLIAVNWGPAFSTLTYRRHKTLVMIGCVALSIPMCRFFPKLVDFLASASSSLTQ